MDANRTENDARVNALVCHAQFEFIATFPHHRVGNVSSALARCTMANWHCDGCRSGPFSNCSYDHKNPQYWKGFNGKSVNKLFVYSTKQTGSLFIDSRPSYWAEGRQAEKRQNVPFATWIIVTKWGKSDEMSTLDVNNPVETKLKCNRIQNQIQWNLIKFNPIQNRIQSNAIESKQIKIKI